MKEAYISLGSNLGKRKETILNALNLLHGEKGIILTRVSGFYETEPWGNTAQPPFINAAAKLLTDKKPEELLDILLQTELKLGRERKEHWGARTIDIDLVCLEEETRNTENLKLPHPYYRERNFVLRPLSEIAPMLIIDGKSVKNHLFDCKDKLSVKKTEFMNLDISLIAATDADGGIGKDGGLLYNIKDDMRYFREKTMGGVVVAGRKTFLTMGALPGRHTIVLSKREKFEDKNLGTAASLTELFGLLQNFRDKKIFAAGGAAVFKELAPYAKRAYITHILSKKSADTFMPILYDFKLESLRFTKNCDIHFAYSIYEK